MELSHTERLLLINQYEILKLLEPDKAAGHEASIAILRCGYELFYDDLFLPFTHMPVRHSEFVLEVLAFYRHVEGYKTHFPEDREIHRRRRSHFEGFCDRGEGELMEFARFLIQVRSRYPEQLQYRSATSNWAAFEPMSGHYTRLLEAWRKLGSPLHLTPDHIKILLP